MSTKLNNVLSGLFANVSGVHTNFVRYDDSLSGVLSTVNDLNQQVGLSYQQQAVLMQLQSYIEQAEALSTAINEYNADNNEY